MKSFELRRDEELVEVRVGGAFAVDREPGLIGFVLNQLLPRLAAGREAPHKQFG